MLNIFTEYAEQSTIHSMAYMGRRKMHLLER